MKCIETGNTYSDNYEIIAEYREEEILEYKTFGSYQGEWYLVSKDNDGLIKVYLGDYGSCSGCDAFESSFGWSGNEYQKDIEDFVYKYNADYKFTIDELKIAYENDKTLHSFILLGHTYYEDGLEESLKKYLINLVTNY